jgi:hypothetical protein
MIEEKIPYNMGKKLQYSLTELQEIINQKKALRTT